METKKSKFDGLVVKFNDYLKTGIRDCELCCLRHSDACDHCPLVDVHCYFVNPSPLVIKSFKFDGLVVKFNDYLKTGIRDCELCCLRHSDACDHCPLVDVNCYFVNPSPSVIKSFDD